MTKADNVTSVIEYLRKKMIGLAGRSGSLDHQDVIRVSQKLDLYLVQAQVNDRRYREGNGDGDNAWKASSSIGNDLGSHLARNASAKRRFQKVDGGRTHIFY